MRALKVLLVSCLESFKPVAWYAAPLTKNNRHRFRASIGASKHNTTWEALVAVRHMSGLSAFSGMVRLSSKSPTSKLLPRNSSCTQWSSRLTSWKYPAGYLVIWAPEPHPPRPLECVPQQQAAVLDCWFWKTAVAKHRSGTLVRRFTPRALLFVAALRVPLVTWPRAVHATQAHVGSQPAFAAW